MQNTLNQTSAKSISVFCVARYMGNHLTIKLAQINAIADMNIRRNDSYNEAELNELAASIAAVGLKNPVRVRRGGLGATKDMPYVAIDGFRRIRAAFIAKLDAIECIVEDAESPDDDKEQGLIDTREQLIHGVLNRALTPLEQADAVVQLMADGKKASVIAKETGLSPSRISQLENIGSFPEGVKSLISKGKISAWTALSMRGKLSDKEFNSAVLKAVQTATDAGKKKATAAKKPATSTPATSTPATSTPATSTPATSTPATSTPATGTPATGTPATSTPATSTPTAKEVPMVDGRLILQAFAVACNALRNGNAKLAEKTLDREGTAKHLETLAKVWGLTK